MPPPRAGNASRLRDKARLGDRFQLAQALHQAGRLADAGSIYQEILRLDPRHADALHFLGLVALQTQQPERGVRLIEKAVALQPNHAEARSNLGIGYAELGRHQDALASYDKALALKPDLADAHDNRGNVLRDLRQYEAAIASHDRAIALRPDDAGAYSNRGNAWRDLHRHQDSLASYDRAITLQPDFIEARCNRAAVLQAMRRHDEALSGLDQVIAVAPGHAEAHNVRGNVLRDLRRYDDALTSFATAIALKPAFAEAHNNHGNALRDLRRPDEALLSYARAIVLRPDHAEAHNNRGSALQDLQLPDAALTSYATAIALKPDYAQAYYNLGNTLASMQRMTAAIVEYDRALALRPNEADAHRARGIALYALKRYREALASYERALALDPDTAWLPGDILSARRQICDWTSDDAAVAALEQRIRLTQKAASPFVLLGAFNSPLLQRNAAATFADSLYPANDSLPALTARAEQTRIRLAYVSSDFRDHAMMHLMIDLFTCHNRAKFEVIALSLGPDTQDDWRQRIRTAFDRFIDVRTMTDRDVALLARTLRIDIAVDLMGYTMGHRTGIFSYRAAPVQVVYLGYPATMGAAYFDYLIADRTLIPAGTERHYSEKIAYLPDTYQVNQRQRRSSGRTPTRAEHGLPDDSFVFCCFNSNYKITPRVFDAWMRILRRIDGSVLWLLDDNADAVTNLKNEAAGRGVAPQRLIFAPRQSASEHLARHRLADLFLDTLPYNAHTTASDALWTGLPVLTCLGESFAGRVAASLLRAIGLPELIATTAYAYEERAVEFATHPGRLQAIKAKLEANRLATPLFDPRRFAGHIEAAYLAMHARARAGLPPAAIHIEDDADALHDPPAVRRKTAEERYAGSDEDL